jgi:hypothetical protein
MRPIYVVTDRGAIRWLTEEELAQFYADARRTSECSICKFVTNDYYTEAEWNEAQMTSLPFVEEWGPDTERVCVWCVENTGL